MSGFQGRTLAVLLMGIISFSSLPIYAEQDSTVVNYIGNFRSVDAALPTAPNQKGSIGYILANIFNGSTKIKFDYLDIPGYDPTALFSFAGTNIFGAKGGNTTVTGNYNIGIGSGALSALTSGNNNTALGIRALQSNDSGYLNTAVGKSALQSNITGYNNTAF